MQAGCLAFESAPARTPWMPRRCIAGARFKARCSSGITSSRNSPTSGRSSTVFACFTVGRPWRRARIDERLEQFEPHFFGRPHDAAAFGPTTITRTPESRRACRQVLEPCPACLPHIGQHFTTLLAPVMTVTRRPCRTNASRPPAACAFRLRMMMSARATPSAASSDCWVDDAAVEVVEIGGPKRPPSSGTADAVRPESPAPPSESSTRLCGIAERSTISDAWRPLVLDVGFRFPASRRARTPRASRAQALSAIPDRFCAIMAVKLPGRIRPAPSILVSTAADGLERVRPGSRTT